MFKRIKRWFQRPQDPSGNIYYVKLHTPDGVFYKIGYTKKTTLHERFAYGGQGDEHLIAKELLFTFRTDAWDVEQTLLEHFDKVRAFGKYSSDPTKPLFKRGQSELFSSDVLGLDDRLYQLTVEEQRQFEEGVGQFGGGCLVVVIGLVLVPFTLGFSLLFLIAGLGEMFGSAPSAAAGPRQRPKHPSHIAALIQDLARGK